MNIIRTLILLTSVTVSLAAFAGRMATEAWVRSYVATNTTQATSGEYPSLAPKMASVTSFQATDESNETYTVTFRFNGATNTALRVHNATNMPSWFTNGMEFVRSDAYGTGETNRLYVLEGTQAVDLVIRTVKQPYLYNGYWQYVTNGATVVTNALYASTNMVDTLVGECVIDGDTFIGYNIGTDRATVFSFWSGDRRFDVNLCKTKKTVQGGSVFAAVKRSFWDCVLGFLVPTAEAVESVRVNGYPLSYSDESYNYTEDMWEIKTDNGDVCDVSLENYEFTNAKGEVTGHVDVNETILAIESGKNVRDPDSFPFLETMTNTKTPVPFKNATVADIVSHLENIYFEKATKTQKVILKKSTYFQDMVADKANRILAVINQAKEYLATSYGKDVETDDYVFWAGGPDKGYVFYEWERTAREKTEVVEPDPPKPPPPIIVHVHGNWKGFCGLWRCTRDPKCAYVTDYGDDRHPAVHKFVPASCNSCKWCGYHDSDVSHHYGFHDDTWKTVGADGSEFIEEHKCVCRGGEIAREHEANPLDVWAMESESVQQIGYPFDPTFTNCMQKVVCRRKNTAFYHQDRECGYHQWFRTSHRMIPKKAFKCDDEGQCLRKYVCQHLDSDEESGCGLEEWRVNPTGHRFVPTGEIESSVPPNDFYHTYIERCAWSNAIAGAVGCGFERAVNVMSHIRTLKRSVPLPEDNTERSKYHHHVYECASTNQAEVQKHYGACGHVWTNTESLVDHKARFVRYTKRTNRGHRAEYSCSSTNEEHDARLYCGLTWFVPEDPTAVTPHTASHGDTPWCANDLQHYHTNTCRICEKVYTYDEEEHAFGAMILTTNADYQVCSVCNHTNDYGHAWVWSDDEHHVCSRGHVPRLEEKHDGIYYCSKCQHECNNTNDLSRIIKLTTPTVMSSEHMRGWADSTYHTAIDAVDPVYHVLDCGFLEAFSNATKIVKADFGALLTAGNRSFECAFADCTSLSQVVFTNMTSAGPSSFYRAFWGDRSLAGIHFPKIETIGSGAFSQAFVGSGITTADFSGACSLSGDEPFAEAFHLTGETNATLKSASFGFTTWPVIVSVRGEWGLTLDNCIALETLAFDHIGDIPHPNYYAANAIPVRSLSFGSATNADVEAFAATINRFAPTLRTLRVPNLSRYDETRAPICPTLVNAYANATNLHAIFLTGFDAPCAANLFCYDGASFNDGCWFVVRDATVNAWKSDGRWSDHAYQIVGESAYHPNGPFPSFIQNTVETAHTYAEWNSYLYHSYGTFRGKSGTVEPSKFRMTVESAGTGVIVLYEHMTSSEVYVAGPSFTVYTSDFAPSGVTLVDGMTFHLYYDGTEL